MNKYRGKALKYKDNINTDIISPPAYMELSIEEASKYAMSSIDEDFSKKVNDGDIFVAEENLGSGSSRETAPLTLKCLGIRCIAAKSYARIFYRNCINLGILAVECQETEKIDYFDDIEVDARNGKIINYTKNEEYEISPIPSHILDLIEVGGLVESLKQKS